MNDDIKQRQGEGRGQGGRAGRYRIRGWLCFSVLYIVKGTFSNAEKTKKKKKDGRLIQIGKSFGPKETFGIR